MRHNPESIRFGQPGKAQSNLERVEARLGSELMAPLGALLEPSPDPDGVLNLLERYARAAPPDVARQLASWPGALTYLVAAFGFSSLLANAFLAEPGLALQFARDRHFTRLKSREELTQDYARFSATQAARQLAAQLARFKRRNYLRIALKDVLGLATLAETTLELSALADVILTEVLLHAQGELEKRYGRPQYADAQGRIVPSGFSIISLGKLGGSELNYSSDIDLLFLYARDGETAGAPGSAISNKEFFVRLAQAVTQRLTEATPEGQVFRVDLRLRPEGDQGDLTLSLGAAMDYYAHRARDWELQMLIKARHSAGNARLTRAFLRGVESQIYSSPADFEAVESVLASRERISRRLRESHLQTLDVKRHRGGIRDIEFLTQCLQRLYGAREPWVRSGGTLHALRKLNDKGLLSDGDYAALSAAYEFLRRVEHRLQLERGQQTHRLPSDREALDRLARRVGVEAAAGEAVGPALLAHLNHIFGRVDEVYQRVIHPRAAAQPAAEFELKPVLAAEASPHSYPSALRLLEARAPELAHLLREAGLPPRTRPRAARLVAALFASPEAFAFARERPAAMERALHILRVSEYLSELLIRHPEELAVLETLAPAPSATMQLEMQLDENALPSAADAVGSGRERCGGLPGIAAGRSPTQPFLWVFEERLGVREKTSLLRQTFRTHVLELGARDCLEVGDVFDRLRHWSDLASRSAATALVIAEQVLAGAGRADGHLPFAVLGLGRLGLGELDLGSDADLIFVAASLTPPEEILYGARLAERMIEALASYTRDGAVFAVDTRLRPRGVEGELVVTEDALVEYIEESAQPWEAVTYLKAAPVAGSLQLGRQVASRLAERLFERFGHAPELMLALQDMRRRLEKDPKARPSATKTAPGGYYDVDFIVSYLRLRHRLALPAGSNMLEQIEALAAAGALLEPDARMLASGAIFLRSVDHAVRLVTGRAGRGLPERAGQAEAVEHLLRRWGLVANEDSPAARLREAQQKVREVYRRLVGSE